MNLIVLHKDGTRTGAQWGVSQTTHSRAGPSMSVHFIRINAPTLTVTCFCGFSPNFPHIPLEIN